MQDKQVILETEDLRLVKQELQWHRDLLWKSIKAIRFLGVWKGHSHARC